MRTINLEQLIPDSSTPTNKRKVQYPLLYFAYNPKSQFNNAIEEIFIKVIPESLSYDRAPNFSEQSLLGRLSPIQVYSSNSAETYGFSINIYEDDIPNNEDIMKYIDRIKRLSYPVKDIQGITHMPQVYFQLGDLSGYGIVQTDISWKTPFRSGHYVLASVSFTVTIERHVYPPEVRQVQLENSEFTDKLIYGDVYYGIPSDELNKLSKDYSLNLNNFVQTDLPLNAKLMFKEDAIRKFDYQLYRLERIVGALGENSKHISQDLKDSINNLNWVDLTQSRTSSNAKDYDTLNILLNNQETVNSLLDSIDELYANNRNILPEEKQLLIDEVKSIFEMLKDINEEVLLYAASS